MSGHRDCPLVAMAKVEFLSGAILFVADDTLLILSSGETKVVEKPIRFKSFCIPYFPKKSHDRNYDAIFKAAFSIYKILKISVT